MPKSKENPSKSHVDRQQKPYPMGNAEERKNAALQTAAAAAALKTDCTFEYIVKNQKKTLNSLYIKYKSLAQQLQDASIQIAEERADNESLRKRLIDLQCEYENLELKFENEKEKNESIQGDFTNLKNKYTSVEKLYDQKASEFNKNLRQIKKQIEQERNQSSELKEEIVQLLEQKRCIEVLLDRTNEEFENQLAEMREAMTLCESMNLELDQKIATVVEHHKEVEAVNAEKSQLIQKLQNALKDQQMQQEAQFAALNLEKFNVVKEVYASMRHLKNKLRQKHKELEQLQSALANLNENLKLQTVKYQEDNFSRDLALNYLKTENESLEHCNRQLNDDLESIKFRNEEKLEAFNEEIDLLKSQRSQLGAARLLEQQINANEKETLKGQLMKLERDLADQKMQLEVRVAALEEDNETLRKTNEVSNNEVVTQKMDFIRQLEEQQQQHQMAVDELQSQIITLTAQRNNCELEKSNLEFEKNNAIMELEFKIKEISKAMKKNVRLAKPITPTATVTGKEASNGVNNATILPTDLPTVSQCQVRPQNVEGKPLVEAGVKGRRNKRKPAVLNVHEISDFEDDDVENNMSGFSTWMMARNKAKQRVVEENPPQISDFDRLQSS